MWIAVFKLKSFKEIGGPRNSIFGGGHYDNNCIIFLRNKAVSNAIVK